LKHVDTSRFTIKLNRVKVAYGKEVPKVIRWGAQEIMNGAVKNLTGPGIKPGVKGSENSAIGQSPVPRRTGNLARSMRMSPLSLTEYAVYSDKREASYNAFVHDGTRHMRPRRFLGDVVREREMAITNNIRYVTMKAIRKEGRK